MAYSPSGDHLATARGDGTVRLWDPKTLKELSILKGHTISPYHVAFSLDGRWIASAAGHRWRPDYPGEVILWDADTLKPVKTFKGESYGFFGVAFSPDSKRLAAAAMDGSVPVWELPSPFTDDEKQGK